MDWTSYVYDEGGAKLSKNKTNELSSLNLGVCDEMIKVAAEELGVEYPQQLKEIWKVSNGLELPGGWFFLLGF